MRLPVEEAEAALRSERDVFEEVRECLTDYLNWVQIALEEAKVRKQEAVTDCQHVLKVFKFKKYIEGYEDGKCGASLRCSLDIGSFLRGEGWDPLESNVAHAGEVETSLHAPSSDATPLTSSSLLIALDARRVAGASSVTVGETSPNTPSNDVVPPATSPPLTVLNAG